MKKKDNLPTKKENKVMGRPTLYTKELCDEICFAIATSSKGLHRLCRENENFPSYKTIFNWILNNKEFLHNYEKAREAQAEYLFEEIVDIADDKSNDTLITGDGVPYVNKEWVQRSRLKVDARKWAASKLLPKRFGDKVGVEIETGYTIEIGFKKPKEEDKD